MASAFYRIGLDIGTNSIGWAVLELDATMTPLAVVDMGSRIFSDGRDEKGNSLAVTRRLSRGMRRNRDRRLLRKRRLMNALIRHGLMPEDESARKKLETLDPYPVRRKALYESVPLHHLGRALFHLNERRGFQSNRKAGKNEQEDGAISKAVAELERKMLEDGAQTYGEWLALRHERRETVRVRGEKSGPNKPTVYDFYPLRNMLKAEFDRMWHKQRAFWPQELTETAKADILREIFHQRPLKPVVAGKCTLDPATTRGERALPTLQLCRLYQEVNALRLKSSVFDKGQPLTRAQRDTIVAKLRTSDASFTWIRKALHLPADILFSLESERRPKLAGDETAIAVRKIWPEWSDLSLERQDACVRRLLDEADDAQLTDWLEDTFGLTEEQADELSRLPLKEQRQRISPETARSLLPFLQEEVIPYHEAVKRAFGHSHSDFETGEVMDTLPYYGVILRNYLLPDSENKLQGCGERGVGRIANPTVHIALNQIRHIVNDVIRRYGKPTQIVVELLRDLKLGQEAKDEIAKAQKKNQDANDLRRTKLAEENLPDNRENLLRLRLWEELGADPLTRFCPYTGTQISQRDLFSDKFEIEHILPKSWSLDNSPPNLTIALRAANRTKSDDTPWEAMEKGNTWFTREQLEKSASYLPKNKAWRFGPGARERFLKGGDFLDRQLTDSAYLARVTCQYLRVLVEDKRSGVWSTPGKLTAMMRHDWGLNTLLGDDGTKNRLDHRHHAVDAVVIALTDRSTLQKVSTLNARTDGTATWKIRFGDPPIPDLRNQIAAHLAKMVVSHKPDHGLGGALFKETNYGIAANGLLVTRKPVTSLTIKNLVGQKAVEIADKKIGEELTALAKAAPDDKALTAALAHWSAQTGTRRVRVRIRNSAYVVIADRKTGQPYKALLPEEQHHLDILETPERKWTGHYVSLIDANTTGKERENHPNHAADTLIMRLHKNDLVRVVEDDGRARILRVMGLNPSLRNITAVEHTQAGKPGSDFKPENWGIGKLQKHKAIRLVVDPLGKTVKAAPPS